MPLRMKSRNRTPSLPSCTPPPPPTTDSVRFWLLLWMGTVRRKKTLQCQTYD
ncbi:unnamed protein product [Dibothriocephalus latus]|uniref:Uncharacterized protein n=1 Tax=Dibothriocephalus latus TaxID=60516 RepID=A0A3P7LAC7_DIBLA|nr:unnamed protein product [Dibothriocephalus latus]